MAADYYTADTENGDHIDDPSEDALFMLMDDLNEADNTFITITPAHDASAWYASITVASTGSYDVERRDVTRNEHETTTSDDPDQIARDLTIWLAARNYPNL